MGRKRNTFSKAIKQLKSTRIDEKLQVLNEIPTNSTSGMYALVPGALTRVEIDKENPVVPDYDTIDWDVDGGDGKDTSGLFDNNGDSKFIAPPGDNSYIQGPMAAMYYTWSYPWTTIGYIRESDRRMINLGRIDGKLGDWDGSSGNANSGSGTFYSYGQLTAEQAQWFRDTKKKDNAGNDPENANYRAFYPGPPSNTPDAFGRYYCTITGTPIAEKDNEKVVAPIDLQPSDILSAILDRLGKGERLSKREREWLKGKLPRIDSIQGNRLSKEAWAMDPDKFREKYGMDPEDVREYYRRFPYGDPSAESQSQPEPQENKFLNDLGKKFNDAKEDVDNWMNKLKGMVKGGVDYLKLAQSGVEAVPTSADALFQYLNNNDPKHPDYRTNDPRSENYTGPYEPEQSAKWKNDVAGQIKNSLPPEVLERAKNSPDGKVELTQYEITQLSNNMKPWNKGDMRFHTFFNSLPVADEHSTALPDENSPTRVTIDSEGNIDIVSNYRFSDRDDVSSGGPLMKMYVQSYMNKDKGTEGTYPFYDRDQYADGERKQTGTTHDVNMRLRLNINGNNKSSRSERTKVKASDVKNFKTGMMSLMNNNQSSTSQSQSQTKKPVDDKVYTGGSKDFDERGTDDINYAHKPQSQSQTQKVPTVKSVVALTKPGRVYAGGPGWDPKSGTISSPGGGDINYAHKPQNQKVSSAKPSTKKDDKVYAGGPGWDPKSGGSNDDINYAHKPPSAKPSAKKDDKVYAGGPGWDPKAPLKGKGANKSKSGNKGIKKSKDGKVYTGGSKDFDERTGKYRSKTGKKSKGGKVYTGGSKRFNERTGKYESTSLRGTRLSESRRSDIMKRLKEPVVLPETKQKSYKVAPGKRLNQKTDFQGMDKLIGDTKLQKTFKKPQDIWSQDWQGYNAKLSQDKKNTVLELIGDGKHAFDYMLRDSRSKNAEEMEKFWGLHPELYSYNFDGKKYKATRKEQVRGDYVVFLVDETGKKTSMLQSTLNEKLAEEDEKGMLDEYNKLNPKNEPIPYEKDPLFKKVAKRIKSVTDYPKKPSPKGYPDKAPPKLGPDGFHPEYGKKYKYDKLDPVSAKAMPMQDNPEIDGNIEKARQQPVIEPGKEPKKLPIPKKE